MQGFFPDCFMIVQTVRDLLQLGMHSCSRSELKFSFSVSSPRTGLCAVGSKESVCVCVRAGVRGEFVLAAVDPEALPRACVHGGSFVADPGKYHYAGRSFTPEQDRTTLLQSHGSQLHKT